MIDSHVYKFHAFESRAAASGIWPDSSVSHKKVKFMMHENHQEKWEWTKSVVQWILYETDLTDSNEFKWYFAGRNRSVENSKKFLKCSNKDIGSY